MMQVQVDELTRRFEHRFQVKSRGRKSAFTAQEHAEAVRRALDAGWEDMDTDGRRKLVTSMRFKSGGSEVKIGLSTLASWIDMAKEEMPKRASSSRGKKFSETELLAALATKELGPNATSRDAIIEQIGKIERDSLSQVEMDRAAGLLVAERQQVQDIQDLQVLLGRKIADRVLGRDFHKQ